jgi:hypothetical protein
MLPAPGDATLSAPPQPDSAAVLARRVRVVRWNLVIV